MATRDVTFRYMFPGTTEFLQYSHPFPKHLCVRPQDQPSKELHDAAYDEVSRIGNEHLDECKTLSEETCEECGVIADDLLRTPVLSTIDGPKPFVGVMVTPVCGKQQCARKIVGGVMGTMESFGYVGQGLHDPKVEWKHRCGYCRDWGNVKACRGCQEVAYCGKECQKAAWKTHKSSCGNGLVVEPVD